MTIRITALIAVLCAPLPAFAQTAKVYTNADLGQKTITWQRTVTPEEWSGIVARQFVPPPPIPVFGPSVYVLDWRGDALPAAPSMFGSSSVADRLWSDPMSAFALQHPIEAAYGFQHDYTSSFSRRPRLHVPSSDAQVVTPAARTTPAAPPRTVSNGAAASAGRRVR